MLMLSGTLFVLVLIPVLQMETYATIGRVMLYSGGALLVGVLLWWMVRQLKKRNERLEHLVEQRTARVQTQARQLAMYNAELMRSNQELQETAEEKSKVLGVAAHDVKNALFGIQALTAVMLEEDASYDESTTHRISIMHDSAREALDTINNLLKSEASSVHGTYEHERVNITSLAEMVTHSFWAQAEQKEQTVTCFVPPQDLYVNGDKNRLREAISNLVSNAVKYAPLGSDIRMDVTCTDANVQVAVSDEGPGLGDHEQQGLFQPFKRLSAEPTGGEPSSGLGLYIVKQVAERHNGTVQVDSNPGEGSTFTLVLPRSDCAEHETNEPSSIPSSTTRELQS